MDGWMDDGPISNLPGQAVMGNSSSGDFPMTKKQ
jgi:hypothetical protein